MRWGSETKCGTAFSGNLASNKGGFEVRSQKFDRDHQKPFPITEKSLRNLQSSLFHLKVFLSNGIDRVPF